MIDFNKKKSKILFYEIIEGRSKCLDPFDNKFLYIKHFGDLDSSRFEEFYFIHYDQAVNRGLPTEKEREKYLKEEGLWSESKDLILSNKTEELEKLNESKAKAYLISKINQNKKDIDRLEQEIKNIRKEKTDLIGLTAETYAQNKMEYNYIYNSFHTDETLKYKKFDSQDFEIESIGQFNKYVETHNKIMEKFNIKNIKYLALSEFFQNMLHLCENKAYYFFQKPLHDLTYYQTSLFSYGKYYSTVLSSSDMRKIKNEIKEDPDKLMEWYNTSKNLENKMMQNGPKEGMVFVNEATEEDLAHLNQDSPQQQSALDKLAKEKGGTLSLTDLAQFFKK